MSESPTYIDLREAATVASTGGRWDVPVVAIDLAVDPEQLLANPRNHRQHPRQQAEALDAALDEIGWTGFVIVNQITGYMVDGHLRVNNAIGAGESVPVIYIEVDEETERKGIATHDLIGALATIDRGALAANVSDLTFVAPVLNDIIAEATAQIPDGMSDDPPPPPDPGLKWGYTSWGKSRKVAAAESEVTHLDALYETYKANHGDDDTGFVRWLIDGRSDEMEVA